MERQVTSEAWLTRIAQRLRRWRHPSRSRDDLHAYWRGPGPENAPEAYLDPSVHPRSVFLVELIEKFASPDARVLELGCNAGRNLSFLQQRGFRQLSAVEISEDALALLRERFPELARDAKLHCGPMEAILPSLPDDTYDLIFSMAVLEHVHGDSTSIFADIARIARGHVISIEDEQTVSGRHFPRNYRHVFESLGLRQIHEEACPLPECGLGPEHVVRVFTVS